MNPNTRKAIIDRCAAAQIPIEGAQPEYFFSATRGQLCAGSGEISVPLNGKAFPFPVMSFHVGEDLGFSVLIGIQ